MGVCGEQVGFRPSLTLVEFISCFIIDLSVFALCRTLPRPSPPHPDAATSTVFKELLELLLVREEKLTWMEVGLAVREEKALTKVSADLDAKRDMAEAT
jgi:hypothetical protein